ncbi:MAG: hypothetical protein ABJK64_01165 [Paraglaciecola sp.]|uniref:hypothetical protein n=1 Tax=Paraglaciecola sp. TaxID=1920173 RepID=UPI0032974AB0
MKSEKEILVGFVAHVFNGPDEGNDIFSITALSKHSLTALRMVANDALEVCSGMKKSEQEKISVELQYLGLPALESLQLKAFKEFLKIVNRGRIRHDKEYDIVRSLSQTTVLDQEHQELAYQLLDGFN